MSSQYGPEAVEYCFRLYLKYCGRQHHHIEAEMRKLWPKWSISNLHSSGDGRSEGWINKYKWKEALKLRLEQRPQTALNSAQKVVNEIDSIRTSLYAQITSQGAGAGKDTVQQHLKYCDLSIDALKRLEAARGTLSDFADFWESLMDWAPEIDEKAALALFKISDQILNRAAAKYGRDQKEAPAVR
jgi:hypothetical protein